MVQVCEPGPYPRQVSSYGGHRTDGRIPQPVWNASWNILRPRTRILQSGVWRTQEAGQIRAPVFPSLFSSSQPGGKISPKSDKVTDHRPEPNWLQLAEKASSHPTGLQLQSSQSYRSNPSLGLPGQRTEDPYRPDGSRTRVPISTFSDQQPARKILPDLQQDVCCPDWYQPIQRSHVHQQDVTTQGRRSSTILD